MKLAFSLKLFMLILPSYFIVLKYASFQLEDKFDTGRIYGPDDFFYCRLSKEFVNEIVDFEIVDFIQSDE